MNQNGEHEVRAVLAGSESAGDRRAPVRTHLESAGGLYRLNTLADALYERGLRHGYADPLGKIDVEEVARWCLEAMLHIDGQADG
jgi:hypothetical protein